MHASVAVLQQLLLLLLVAKFSDCLNNNKPPFRCQKSSEFACKADRFCIPDELVCDGKSDCHNGEDEKGCENRDCKPGQFKCVENPGMCIDQRRKCDGRPDCIRRSSKKHRLSSSDEENCDGFHLPQLCKTDEFACSGNTSHCIRIELKCDKHNDCPLGDDERECPCKGFTCHNGQCIDEDKHCNGEKNCNDGSDEDCRSYHRPDCSYSDYVVNGICIRKFDACDDKIQHLDSYKKYDELCSTTLKVCSNKDKRWNCTDGKHCILKTMRCDGISHCEDRSDEQGCSTAPPKSNTCSEGLYKCGRECLNIKMACEGHIDHQCRSGDRQVLAERCRKYEMERNLCKDKRCTHGCKKELQEPSQEFHAVCTCPTGYGLNEDGLSCSDVNECSKYGSCSQFCKNTKGSYTCSCLPGYELEGTSCVAKDRPLLLISAGSSILSLTKERSKQLKSSKPELNADIYHPTLLTANDESVFFVTFGKLVQLFSNGSSQVLLKDDITGLAIGWQPQLLLFTVNNPRDRKGHLMAMNVTTRRTVKLMSLECPTALTAVPQLKQLFVILDCHNSPGIYSIKFTQWPLQPELVMHQGFDKTMKQLFVDTQQEPNRIYWTSVEENIYSCQLDGKRFQRVGDSKLPGASSAIAVFEDSMMWVDHRSAELRSANKFNGTNVESLKKIREMQSLFLRHPLLEASSEAASCDCGHVCIGTSSSSQAAKEVCLCESPYKLQNATGTCQLEAKFKQESSERPRTASSRESRMQGQVGSVASIVIAALSACLLLAVLVSVICARRRRTQQQQQSAMHFANDNYDFFPSAKAPSYAKLNNASSKSDLHSGGL